jgi:transcriptional regulator with XRE-family HTH domain
MVPDDIRASISCQLVSSSFSARVTRSRNPRFASNCSSGSVSLTPVPFLSARRILCAIGEAVARLDAGPADACSAPTCVLPHFFIDPVFIPASPNPHLGGCILLETRVGLLRRCARKSRLISSWFGLGPFAQAVVVRALRMLKSAKSVCSAVSSGTAVLGPGTTFADRVAGARLRLGLTKRGLASKAGLAPRTVARIEAGDPVSSESKLALEHALGLLPPTADDGDDAGRDMSDVAIGRRLRDLRRARGSIPLSDLAFILGNVSEASLSRMERGLCRPRRGWSDLLTDDYARILGFACAKDLGDEIGVET